MSEHNDEFQVFVPYSLNRKNRWNTIKLEECLANAGSNGAVKVSGVEGYLASNIRKHVDQIKTSSLELLATKYVEKNADNSLTTRATQSARGAPVIRVEFIVKKV